MDWSVSWPMGLMLVSLVFFVSALFAVARFLRNASGPQENGLERPDDGTRTDGG